ncbi:MULTISPECIES: LysR family transcriptional regulator [Brevibacillus]|uniref:LysR family transcriptional regulator n=1 Tax=Brevibacillus TaxID=55080 RepID=UPI00115715CC|nr:MULTISPECIES: LysR family transcriptional regulator [Bacillales]MBH0332821.1 transcriptional regulator [Brevibacillus brevis]NRR03873.1 LysR family transcriptional regulator [Brevibacillus sp. RS1.1]NRS47093.1 LysR family transcriptional regulator [Brevibacillus sp. HB2.2]TQR34870.1 LysR family transcriptional regulator [Lysinibacillus sp. SDF0063]
MEIRQFQTFKAVVDFNSFTKAAQALQYSQATITSHIQQLEEGMGVPLFDRLGKKIQLTAYGRELYTYVEELLVSYAKIKDISANEQSLQGELRIGASETITIYRLGDILSKYRESYPGVNISFVMDDCSRLREKLHDGLLDIVITLEPKLDDPNLVVEPFSTERLVFIGGRDHSFEKIEDAGEECMIFSGEHCALRRFFQRFLEKREIKPKHHLEFSSMEAIKQSVANGLGVSLMPYISVEALLNEQKVKMIACEEELLFYAQIAYHKNKWLSRAHKKFIDLMLESRDIG